MLVAGLCGGTFRATSPATPGAVGYELADVGGEVVEHGPECWDAGTHEGKDELRVGPVSGVDIGPG